MQAIKWSDKRVVTALTTIHTDTTTQVERRSRCAPGGREMVEKPTAIVEYNRFIGGVDLADQLLSYYGFGHRTVRWWRRAFFFLFDMAVVNSYILYTLQNPDRRRRLSHEQFRVQLAPNLLQVSGEPVVPRVHHGPNHHSQQPAARLTERHFPSSIGHNEAGRPVQKDCAVCSKRKGRGRKTSTYMCRECSLPMCIVPCFELHHTKTDPQRCLTSGD